MTDNELGTFSVLHEVACILCDFRETYSSLEIAADGLDNHIAGTHSVEAVARKFATDLRSMLVANGWWIVNEDEDDPRIDTRAVDNKVQAFFEGVVKTTTMVRRISESPSVYAVASKDHELPKAFSPTNDYLVTLDVAMNKFLSETNLLPGLNWQGRQALHHKIMETAAVVAEEEVVVESVEPDLTSKMDEIMASFDEGLGEVFDRNGIYGRERAAKMRFEITSLLKGVLRGVLLP